MTRFFRIFVFGAALFAATASAQDRSADALIDRGIVLFRDGQYAAALDAFEDAHRRSPTIRSTAQVGVTEHALGHYVRAFEMLRRALDAQNDSWLTRARRQTIQEAFDATRAFVAEVEVRGDIPLSGSTIEVFVNGERRGTWPLREAVPVLAGRVEVELRAEGETSARATKRLTVEPRTVAVTTFAPADLANASRSPTPNAAQGTASSTDDRNTFASDTSSASSSEGSSNAFAIAGWTSIGIGAAALATGAVFHVLREQSVDEHNARADCGTELAVEGAGCSQLRSDGSTRQVVMITGYVVGGAAVVAGIVLLALPKSEPDESSAAVSCAPTFGTWGLACQGTF